jgi:hypothetical protein
MKIKISKDEQEFLERLKLDLSNAHTETVNDENPSGYTPLYDTCLAAEELLERLELMGIIER